MIWRTYGRLLFAACFFACLLVDFFAPQIAHAIDTSTCGYLKCENDKANQLLSSFNSSGYQYTHYGAPPDSYDGSQWRWLGSCAVEGTVQTYYNNNSYYPALVYPADPCTSTPGSISLSYGIYYPTSTGHPPYYSYQGSSCVSQSAQCACSSQPMIPDTGGWMPGNSIGRFCRAGCLYKPASAGFIGTYIDPGNPTSQYVISDGVGYVSDSGLNCDPVSPPSGTVAASSSTSVPPCSATSGGKDCVVKDTTHTPEYFCVSHEDLTIGCLPASSSGCMPNPSVSGQPTFCKGNPPPDPTPPSGMYMPPPDVPHLSGFECSGSSCNSITLNVYPPPSPTQQCPAGTTGLYPNCVSTLPCPDGSTPVAGTCPAPPATTCPDGTAPVNGLCNAPPGGGSCPNGSPPTGGLCYVGSGSCPDGSTPVAGRCPSGTGNGGNGNNNGNSTAGGGQTCLSPPTCAGDPVGCAQLNQIWLDRCSPVWLDPTGLAGLNQNGIGGFTGSDPGSGTLPDKTLADGGFTGSPVTDLGDPTSSLNTSGWLGGAGSCPQYPNATISFMDKTIDLNVIDYCWIFPLIHGFALAIAFIRAARIIAA